MRLVICCVPVAAARRRRRLGAQQAPDRSHPPAARPGAGAQAAGDREAAAVERPAGLDRRAARGAGRPGEPRRVQRQRPTTRPASSASASLTAAMLEEGAGSRSALEIADAVDFLGADLGTTSGIDSSAVRLHVPVARLADALPIMADVALRPTFPKDELERLRRERLTALLAGARRPARRSRRSPSRASCTARPIATARAHARHGRDDQGASPTDDLRAFYASAFRPGQRRRCVVGRRHHAGRR